jgi:hypothetical protein
MTCDARIRFVIGSSAFPQAAGVDRQDVVGPLGWRQF